MLRSSRRRDSAEAFTDLLFNALLGFVFMFAIAVIFMNPIAKTGVIDTKAEYLITVTWPEGNSSDVDTWTQDPAGNISGTPTKSTKGAGQPVSFLIEVTDSLGAVESSEVTITVFK